MTNSNSIRGTYFRKILLYSGWNIITIHIVLTLCKRATDDAPPRHRIAEELLMMLPQHRTGVAQKSANDHMCLSVMYKASTPMKYNCILAKPKIRYSLYLVLQISSTSSCHENLGKLLPLLACLNNPYISSHKE